MNFVDRGYAVLIRDEDGSHTVAVAAAINDGEPTDVVAKHVGVPDVRVDPGIALRQAGHRRYTTQIVEVAPDNGVLRVRATRADSGLPI